MSTIDMKQVAGLQAVNAEGNVIGTLSVDDLTELVSAKIIQEAKNEAVSARSASVMSEASTLAATDEYEDKLDIDTNPAYVRSLDSEGNPKRTATTSLATVVGGLLPVADASKNGLMDKNYITKFGTLFLPVLNAVLLTNKDANKIYTELGTGYYVFLISSGFSNFPFTEQGGLLIHIQRSGIGSITTSQLIYQKAISSAGVKERIGYGNSNTIIYGEWG